MFVIDGGCDPCVLVNGWKGSSWHFPRGKKNKDEEDDACAIREVLEETGFNILQLINKDEYIEMIFGPQRVRLYIVGGGKAHIIRFLIFLITLFHIIEGNQPFFMKNEADVPKAYVVNERLLFNVPSKSYAHGLKELHVDDLLLIYLSPRLIEECWHEKPDARPTFREIITRLKSTYNFVNRLTIEVVSQSGNNMEERKVYHYRDKISSSTDDEDMDLTVQERSAADDEDMDPTVATVTKSTV
ncbi:mRNA-decapping enzyme subunit 2 [Tanacetum coccineum]